jgi:hypothetical protein
MRDARGASAASPAETELARLHAQMLSILALIQGADVRPASQMVSAARELTSAADRAIRN